MGALVQFPRYEHDDYASSLPALKIKRARLEVRVEALTRGTTPDHLWPQAQPHQVQRLKDMLMDLDGPSVYDRLVEDLRFDPVEGR